MPLRRSHGRTRPENGRLPHAPQTALTAPDRDPSTGRFVPGNKAGTRRRRRALERAGKTLAGVDLEHAEKWLRPYVESARAHAEALIASLPEQTPLTCPLAEELASARLVYRGLLSLGAGGDQAALREARSWLRECRQHLIALTALMGDAATSRPDDLSWLQVASDRGRGSQSTKSETAGARHAEYTTEV